VNTTAGSTSGTAGDAAGSSGTDGMPSQIVCSRCQTPSNETRSMVSFAINCYYCARCARLVGYGG
jgi:late competence protein required for DNA uptake (superfamily II DNA/RNA helicase)